MMLNTIKKLISFLEKKHDNIITKRIAIRNAMRGETDRIIEALIVKKIELQTEIKELEQQKLLK